MRRPHAIGGTIGAAITTVMLVMAVLKDREERQMIAAGLCEAREEAWYQPPPTSICTMRTDEGHCLMWRQYQDDPYLRTFWVCQGGESFWRRKVHD